MERVQVIFSALRPNLRLRNPYLLHTFLPTSRYLLFILCIIGCLLWVQHIIVSNLFAADDQTSAYPTTGLVAYYTFNNQTNDAITANHAVIEGNGIQYVTGVHGNAIKFGGYNVDRYARLKVPTSSSLQFSSAASFSMWMRLDSSIGQTSANCSGGTQDGAFQTLIGKSNDRYGLLMTVHYQNNQTHIISGLSSDGNLGFESGSTAAIQHALGNWLHVAQVFDATGAKLYLNGALAYHDTRTPNFSLANSRVLYFGLSPGEGSCASWWYPLNGALDEVRIYNRGLTAAEVQELYQYPVEPTSTSTFTPVPTATATSVPTQTPTVTNTPTTAATCPSTLCNGDFSAGLSYWSSTENATIVAGRNGQGIQISYDGGNADTMQNLRGTFVAGRTYQASVWCKAAVGVACRLFLGDTDSGYENTASTVLYGTGEWQHLTAIVTPTKDELMSLWLYSPTPGSVAIYDDVEVKELTCPVDQLCNGDFEQGMAHWHMDVSSSVAAPAYQGQYALRSTQLRDGGSPVWTGVNQKIQVTPNRSYGVTARMKWDYAVSMHVKVEWFDSNGAKINAQQLWGDTATNSGGWVAKSATMTAPANAATAALIFWHGVDNDLNVKNSTLWIDNVVVSPVNAATMTPTPTATPPNTATATATPPKTATATITPTPTNDSTVQAHIRIGTHTAAPGLAITVPVIGEVTGDKIGAVAVTVYYDTALLDATVCQPNPNNVFNGAVCNPAYVDSEGSNGAIRFELISGQGIAGTATLANLAFQVKGNSDVDTTLTVYVDKLSNPAGRFLNVQERNGVIQIRITGTGGTATPTVTNTPIPGGSATPTPTSPAGGTPTVTILGDTTGAPGSYFVVQGTNFPPNSTVSLFVNGIFASNLPVDANGTFTAVLLTTTQTPTGAYQVSTGEQAGISATFVVDRNAPLEQPTPVAPQVPIHSGNAIYLPLIAK